MARYYTWLSDLIPDKSSFGAPADKKNRMHETARGRCTTISCCLSVRPWSSFYSSSCCSHFSPVRSPCACAFGVTCSPSVKTLVPKLHVMVGVGSPVASHVNLTCSSISVVVWLSRYVILGCTERTDIIKLDHSKMTLSLFTQSNDVLNPFCGTQK